MISRRGFIGAGALAPMAASAAQAAAPVSGPPTVREIFADPQAIDAAVSPDGRTIAVLRQTVERVPRVKYRTAQRQYPDKFKATLALRSTTDVDTVRTIEIGPLRTFKLAWANSDLMLVWVRWESSNVQQANRLALVGRDGKTLRYLLATDKELSKYNPNHANVMDLLPNDPQHILLALAGQGTQQYALYKVNLYDDSHVQVDEGGLQTKSWYMQNGVPVIREDVSISGKSVSVMGRAPGEKTWKLIRKTPFVLGADGGGHDFEVMGATKTPGVVRVASYSDTEDARLLREFDLTANAWGKRLSTRPVDVADCLTDGDNGYLGASYVNDRVSYDCPDAALNGDLQLLTDTFPTASVSFLNTTPDANHMVFKVSGPQQPGLFVYFNRQAGALGVLDAAQPWLTEDRLQPTEAIDVKTRDGKTVRAYLTGPKGKNLPMIVLPHGGPESRDQIQFDQLAQPLAAQGWLVLQANFRGSAGYGRAFADAGRHHWSDVMMEDIEAAADQVVASGRADAKKVAIFGWSFGGYASLMCGVRRPAAYRAVVSVAGPADLLAMLSNEKAEGYDLPSYKYWVKTIGEPDADHDMLRKSSPFERATEMGAPVLLIHGKYDSVVPVGQSQAMNRALGIAKKPVEYMEVDYMDHSPSDPEDMIRIMEKIIEFVKPKLA